MSYDAEILADSPVAYWKMEEVVQGPVFPTPPGGMIDFGGAALNNWYTGGVQLTQGITGPILTDTSSLGCRGVIGGQPVDPNTPLDLDDDLTWECWSISTASGCETMINRGGDATDTYLAYGVRSTAGFESQALFILQWDAETRALLSCPLATNVWHHVVGTRSGAEMKLYVDGWLVAQRSDCPLTPLTDESALRLGYMSNFFFGAINASSGLSHVALYSHVLPGSRVEAHTVAALGALPASPCAGAISASGSVSASPSATPSASASASPAPCTPPLGAAISCINAKGRLFVTLASDDFTSQVAFAWHEGAERMPISSQTNWKPGMRALTLQELNLAFENDTTEQPLIVSVHRNLRNNYARDARVTAGSNRIDSPNAHFDADNIGDMVAVFGEGIGGPGVHYILGRIEALASPSSSPSPSASPSASPSTTESASPSGSPSASPSSSRSGSPSPSHSPSASPSASPSRSGSASPSTTPSASPSASPSSSQSASPSAS